jgi:hypothetical protein
MIWGIFILLQNHEETQVASSPTIQAAQLLFILIPLPKFRLTPRSKVVSQNQSCISPPLGVVIPNTIRITAQIGMLYRTLSGYLLKFRGYAESSRDNYPYRGVYLDLVLHNTSTEGGYADRFGKSSWSVRRQEM